MLKSILVRAAPGHRRSALTASAALLRISELAWKDTEPASFDPLRQSDLEEESSAHRQHGGFAATMPMDLPAL